MLNGGILGVVALLLHAVLYRVMGGEGRMIYALASVLTYIPLIVLNFAIQRALIFSAPGRFWKFVSANCVIMVFVSAISPFCRDVMAAGFGPVIGDNTGFILAALIGAVPSFVLARFWVFQVPQERTA